MRPQAFMIHNTDNVATLLNDATAGPVSVLGGEAPLEIMALDDIANGHKIAVRAIPKGAPVIKFGVSIGSASMAVKTGEWVHLHNCVSNFDTRSATLDLHTGATTDTTYE